MVFSLPKHAPTYWAKRVLFIVLLYLNWIGQTPGAQAQAISTNALAVSVVCPGSQIDVMGVRSGPADSYVVELSDGGTVYTEISSTFLNVVRSLFHHVSGNYSF